MAQQLTTVWWRPSIHRTLLVHW